MSPPTGANKGPTGRKRKNAAQSPPPSDRQTRNRSAQKSPARAMPADLPETVESQEPEKPRKRPRPRTRVKNVGRKSLGVIAEEEAEDPATISSPTGKTRSAAEILIGISSSTSSEGFHRLEEVQEETTQSEDFSSGGDIQGAQIERQPFLQPDTDDYDYSGIEDEREESPEYCEEPRMPKEKRRRAAKAATAGSSNARREEIEPNVDIHYQLIPRGTKALKKIIIDSDAGYNDFRELMLMELAIPQRKWEGRRLGIKMPDSRVADHPLELTKTQYQETTRLLKDNAIAVERQKKTYEAELAEKEARRSKKKKGNGKKKPELSDADSDALNSDNDASAAGHTKTMTKVEATELLYSKRKCALHDKLCRVLPGGLHVPWSLDAIAIWATLICEGQASADEIPHVLKDDARPRAQESRRASSRDPTPAPPLPIEIKMVYPNFPIAPLPGTSGSLATVNPPSSPTMPVSTADPLIEDFLNDLDIKYQGRDFRNFKQYLGAFEKEAIVRITELGVKDIRRQGAEFYRRAPFNMPLGVANIFFTVLKASLKTLSRTDSVG